MRAPDSASASARVVARVVTRRGAVQRVVTMSGLVVALVAREAHARPSVVPAFSSAVLSPEAAPGPIPPAIPATRDPTDAAPEAKPNDVAHEGNTGKGPAPGGTRGDTAPDATPDDDALDEATPDETPDDDTRDEATPDETPDDETPDDETPDDDTQDEATPDADTTGLDATVESAPSGAAIEATADGREPPRIDGTYVGLVVFGGAELVRVNNLDTPGPFSAVGGNLRFGQMVLPWLGIGLALTGGLAYRSEREARQRVGQGALLVDFEFVPLPRRVNLSLRASFGFGGGAVRQEGVPNRSGFGGAFFGAAVRYLLFPGAKRYRPTRGGGFGLGPELGWFGATPAAEGRPMTHTIFLGLATAFYFGD